MIYRAHWKSYKCPTIDLSITEVGCYLNDKNTMVPTGVTRLHDFLILAHKSRKGQHHQSTTSEKLSSMTTIAGATSEVE